jgi:membrane protein involved in colicin uptake
MKNEGQNQSGEENYGTIIPAPRFDEEAKATARPVMPLRQANGSDFHTSLARGARSTITAKNSWARSLTITLALSAVIVALITIFANYETVSPDSPQATNGAASVIGSKAATETLIRTEMADTSNAPAKTPRESESRSDLPVRYETRRDDWSEEERRGRDEDERDDDDDDKEKLAKRARKQEKKRLERKWREAEKLAERRRDAEKGGEPKPRLIGIYTEKP